MAGGPRSLVDLQAWMQAVITNPEGVAAGVDSDQARQAIVVGSNDVNAVVCPSQLLGSLERLGVYANAYFARLVECLAAEFPALEHALGDETFTSFAASYLAEYPSDSYTLAKVGSRFPEFLRESRPTDVPRPGWPDFLIDLATLERTYAEVFDAPGPEGLQLLTPASLDGIPPERAGNVVLHAVPSLRLLELDFPVHEYVTAVRHSENPDTPPPEPTWLVVTRRDFIVRRGTVSRSEFVLLREILTGHTLNEAIAAAIETTAASVDEFAGRLRAWFRDWAAAGWFERIELSDPPETRQ